MAEQIYLYKDREKLDSLSIPCLVTGPKYMYPDWQEPEEGEFGIHAQWDTGATYTVVSRDIIHLLGLKPTGLKINVHGANGVYESDTYIIDLYISKDIVFKNLRVVEMNGRFKTSVLIGLDVILKSDFLIEPKEGDLIVRFRHPSEGNKPFTTEPEDLFKEEQP